MYFKCFETQVRPGPGGGGGCRFYLSPLIEVPSWADSEGEIGKSQVIWVSIENKQSDTTPPPPLKEVGLPPLENVGPSLEPWKSIVFFESNLWTSVKYVED